MNDADTAKREVAMRQFPTMVKEAVRRAEPTTVEEAADRITAAVGANPTLQDMGENRIDRSEALTLADEVLEEGARQMRREGILLETRRTLEGLRPARLEEAARMDALDRGEPDPNSKQDTEFMDGLVEEFRRKGQL